MKVEIQLGKNESYIPSNKMRVGQVGIVRDNISYSGIVVIATEDWEKNRGLVVLNQYETTFQETDGVSVFDQIELLPPGTRIILTVEK